MIKEETQVSSFFTGIQGNMRRSVIDAGKCYRFIKKVY